MTPAEAVQIVLILKASYPRAEVTPETIKAYSAMLGDIEAVSARGAINRLICKSKWFPTISEIRGEVANGETSHLPAIELAWGEVLKAIGQYGYYRTPEFSCDEIAIAVDAIGWRNLCRSENVVSDRARFTDAYRAARMCAVDAVQLGMYSPQLPSARRGTRHRLTVDVPKLLSKTSK